MTGEGHRRDQDAGRQPSPAGLQETRRTGGLENTCRIVSSFYEILDARLTVFIVAARKRSEIYRV
jgi:hypothetical protein